MASLLAAGRGGGAEEGGRPQQGRRQKRARSRRPQGLHDKGSDEGFDDSSSDGSSDVSRILNPEMESPHCCARCGNDHNTLINDTMIGTRSPADWENGVAVDNVLFFSVDHLHNGFLWAFCFECAQGGGMLTGQSEEEQQHVFARSPGKA